MNDTVNTVAYLITNLFLIIAIIKCVKLFFQQSKCGLIGWTIFTLIFFGVSSCLFLKLNSPFVNLFTNGLFIYFAANLFKGNWQKKILSTVSVLITAMLLDSIVYNLFVTAFANEGESYIRNAITVILLFMGTNILDKMFYYKEKQDINIFSWVLILLVPIGSIIIVATAYIARYSSIANTIIVSILLIINTAVFYLYDSIIKHSGIKHEKQLLTVQNSAYINQFEIIKESQDKIKSLNHDIKNHMIAIQCLLENQKYAEISSHLKKIVDYTESSNDWAKTNNIEIDSFLNYKLLQIKNIGATIECKINIPELPNFDMFDLTIILGNLFDNAQEALSNATIKIFKFSMELEQGIVYIQTANTYGQKPNKYMNKFVTTKQDKTAHGMGLKNIETSLEKYTGTMEINVSNDFFETSIMLYL